MYYYEVAVASSRYHGVEPLTYQSDRQLSPGALVQIALGPQMVVGFILTSVPKPAFGTKSIDGTVHDIILPRELIALHQWLTEYYPGSQGMTTQLFVPGLTQSIKALKPASQPATTPPQPLPPLTPEQVHALGGIQDTSKPVLLHGETGSGKTRVYIELVSKTLQNGQSAIILTPEIGLTPQLTTTFEATFPGKVITIHSTQTTATRKRNWLSIYQANQPIVIIGPRSALFTPVQNLGLIVVDEAHDTAYKQEQMPYYQTTRVAGKLAALHNAQLVLGTATPLVDDLYTFTQKGLPIVRMSTTAAGHNLPVNTTVVDLADKTNFTKSQWLSDALIATAKEALKNNQQVLLFLNRRGTARVVLCRNCTWQAMCPRCDLPLTYHGDNHTMRCHTCGYRTNTPSACPECGAVDIQFKSIGTKTIANEATRLFPSAVIKRFDSDTSKQENLESQYQAIRDGAVDILVGTQMITKGLDLPLLGVVGIVAADASLYFPDYTAGERTFQILRQVIGRVGRGHIPGNVIVQSYRPDAKILQAAVNRDYELFYESQLAERELYRFPPFYFTLKVSVDRASQEAAARTAHSIATDLLSGGLAIEVVGPSPSFVEKVRGKFRWQVVVKARKRTELTQAIRLLPKNCHYDIDPTNLL